MSRWNPWWKRAHVPQIDTQESKEFLRRADRRKPLTDRIVRLATEERIKNHFAQDFARALEVRHE